MRRAFVLLVVVAAAAALGFVAIGVRNSRADPIVRRATIVLPGGPPEPSAIRVALLSDVHLGNPSMDAGRLARIVGQVNALRPDLVLIAGDLLAGDDPRQAGTAAGLVKPLSALRSRLGTVAVLGNHDHWIDGTGIARALRAAGATVLVNRAVVRGPLVVGGIDDEYTGHDRPAKVIAAMARLPGARLVLSHSPDVAAAVRGQAPLLLAGHSHCGQIVLPLIGPLATVVKDVRYRCGLVREPGRVVVVSAGLGTTTVPLRIGAPPDLWLLTLVTGRPDARGRWPNPADAPSRGGR